MRFRWRSARRVPARLTLRKTIAELKAPRLRAAWLDRLVAGIGLALCACSAPTPRPAAGPVAADTKTVSFVASNDVHGHTHSLPLLASHVDHLRSSGASDSVVLLDAGDLFQGTLETNLSQGASVVELYNLLGYDAAALGNHEFDYGEASPSAVAMAPRKADGLQGHPQGALRLRLLEARFPFLSSNLVDVATGTLPEWENLHSSILIERAGVRIGIVGAVTQETPHVVKQRLLHGLAFSDPAQTVAAEAARLRRRGADLVVALVHLGGECEPNGDPHDLSRCDPDSELFRFVRALPAASVDLVFGGHRHQSVAHFVEGIPVAHAFWAGRAFSRIDAQRDAHGTWTFKIFPPREICNTSGAPSVCTHSTAFDGTPLSPKAAVSRRTKQLAERMRQVRSRGIGASSDGELTRDNKSETALGNLFVDLMLQAMPDANIAIANAGSVRAGLPAGELTFGSVYEAMPFDNRISTVRLSGAELRALLVRHVQHQDHGPAAIAGMRVRATCDNGAVVVRIFHSDGRPIGDDEQLTLVTSDFVATGGDDLVQDSLQERFTVHQDQAVRKALLDGLQRIGQVQSRASSLFDPNDLRLQIGAGVSSCAQRPSAPSPISQNHAPEGASR